MVDSKQQWKAWVYLAPAIVLLLVFTVWPIINTLLMAFQNGYSANAAKAGAVFEFGIANFQKVVKGVVLLGAVAFDILSNKRNT